MKRMLMGIAAFVGVSMLAAESAQAQGGGYSMPPPGSMSGPNTLLGMGAPSAPNGQYGLAPSLRRAFRLGGSGCGNPGCGNCGGHSGGPSYGYGAGGNPPGYGVNYAQPTMQGTLVFPNHPFVRSPRDFFMYEPNR